MAGNRFEIQVVALDKASAVFRKVNTSLAQTFRPVVRLQKQVGALGKELHLDKISKGMRGLSAASSKVAQSLGLASAPLEALFGLGTAGGIVAAGAAVVALGAKWGATGFEISRTATAIGVSTDQLQEFRGIAKLSNVDTDKATAALGNLATTMQDAEFGRNAPAYQLMNQFGISTKRTKEGVVDVNAAMRDWADVLQNTTNPQVRALIANALGIGDILPLLMQGSTGFDSLARKAREAGYVLGSQQIKDAQEYEKALSTLNLQVSALASSFGAKVVPALTRGLAALDAFKLSSVSLGDVLGFSPLTAARKAYGTVFGGPDRSAQRSSGVVAGSVVAGSGGGGGGGGDAPIVGPGRLPLGLRQNNPGNLRSWGSNPVENGFARFGTPEAGLSAMAQQIGLYGNRDGLHSINGILGKYAPPNENNTGAYAAAVSKDTGFDPSAQLNTNDPKVLAPLLSAMVKHEQGRQPFGADDYAKAAQSVNVHVAFANAPPGTQAKATGGGGASVPARVSYALAPSDAP